MFILTKNKLKTSVHISMKIIVLEPYYQAHVIHYYHFFFLLA